MQTRQASQQSKDTHAVFQTQRLTNPSTVKPVRRSLHPTVLIQRATAAPGALNRMEVLQLQRTIGNRATGRLVKGRRQNEREEGNTTGLPDHLKTGIETLSGVSLDDVKVHYNSSLPASYEAHAFAKGRDIHVGPGKENSLAHEAWHIVQQRQGRVRANVEMNHHLINADASLEREADKMGWEAAEVNIPDRADSFAKSTISAPILRNDAVMQMDWYEKVGANIILRAGKKTGRVQACKRTESIGWEILSL